MGRKALTINWTLVDEMLSDFCNGTEVADALGIDRHTLERKIKAEFKVPLGTYKAQKRASGARTLRQKQMEIAKGGDRVMLIWLGKQYLDQSDRTDHTSKGEKIPQPLNITVANQETGTSLDKLIKDAAKSN